MSKILDIKTLFRQLLAIKEQKEVHHVVMRVNTHRPSLKSCAIENNSTKLGWKKGEDDTKKNMNLNNCHLFLHLLSTANSLPFPPNLPQMGPQLYALTLLLTTACYVGEAANGEPNATSPSPSPWLGRSGRQDDGCRFRPWICRNQAEPSSRRWCCRNRCVDLRTDPLNCGRCGIRCRFNRQCCHGVCINVMRNTFHCGACDKGCPFPVRCRYGLCGYAGTLPPFPFPFPPLRPVPPFPFPLPSGRPPPASELLHGGGDTPVSEL